MLRSTFTFVTKFRPVARLSMGVRRLSSSTPPQQPEEPVMVPENAPDLDRPPIPPYKSRVGETLQVQKARIVYQSRKRGMLENDLLLSTFCKKYLDQLSPEQVTTFDELINKPDNDWDIYHWIIGKTAPPAEFDTDVLRMIQEFAKNKDMEDRTRMPAL